MRTTFKKKQLYVLTLLALMPGAPVYGACTPAGTDGNDSIVCSGINNQGVDARAGNDGVTVNGSSSVSTTLTDSSGTNTAIQAGDGNDHVSSMGALISSTTSSQSTTSYLFSGSTGHPPILNTAVSASSVGIDGGAGDDILTNRNGMSIAADASIGSTTTQMTVTGADATEVNTTIDAIATGIHGGVGTDTLSNEASISTTGTTSLDSLNTETNMFDTSHTKATTALTSTAIGMDGADGNASTLTNSGSITSRAITDIDNTNVEINLVDASMADASLAANAQAAGVRTGTWEDIVTNLGNITANASVEVFDVSVNASFVDATTADRTMGAASTDLNANAVGIDGSQAQAAQRINNTAGTINANASSDAHALAISLASEGAPSTTEVLYDSIVDQVDFASAGIHANSTATGIATGIGDDIIDNLARINATAGAASEQKSINVGISLVDFKLPTPGIVIGSAGTDSTAVATGIDAGAGNDTVTNRSVIDAAALATAAAVTVSANIAGFSENVLGGGSIPVLGSFSASLVVADTVTAASASATGIQGGEGGDTITNHNRVDAAAMSDGGAVSASATLNIKYKEGENLFSVNAVGARAKTTSAASAVSIDGGSGDDQITNNSIINANAQADARAITAAVAVAGSVKGSGGAANLSVTDTSSEATALAVGVAGGEGNDVLSNAGTINASSDANGLSVGVSIAAAIAKQGLVADVSLARAESNADATSVGIDSGVGHDRLQNTGTINANSTADANAVAVSVSLGGTNKGLAVGAAMTDASTNANAIAIGMKGGADAGVTDSDLTIATISNTNAINVDVEAQTHSVGVSLSVSIAKEGVALGGALADSSTHANAFATGIEGGIDDDRVSNTGSISVMGDADAFAVSVGVSVSGSTSGVAAGAALADASANANIVGIGIDGGAGNDVVRNQNLIDIHNVDADAISVGVSVAGSYAESGVAASAALARSGSYATSSATGLYGNAGGDTLINDNTIRLQHISADADAVTVSLGLAGSQSGVSVSASLADADGEATASATGIDGGADNDFIRNNTTIDINNISSDALAASISLEFSGTNNGVAAGLAVATASARANSLATGLEGGTGDDTLTNTNNITLRDVRAESDAISVSTTFNVALNAGASGGISMTDSSVHSTVVAKGMSGGDGNDGLLNTGTITADNNVGTEADVVSVTIGGQVSMAGIAIGAALSDSSANASTTIAGIDGGAGDDVIDNRGAITLRGTSNIETTSFTLEINAALGVGGGVELVDASANGDTTVIGIDGGTGRNDMINSARIEATSSTNSETLAIGLGAALAVGGDATLVKATANATATAVGIGEVGSPTASGVPGSITNTGFLDVTAEAEVYGTAVSGNLRGYALGETSVHSIADGYGIRSADGATVIDNRAGINVDSDADATGLSVAVTLAGKTMGNANTIADARATGIASGAGDDQVQNSSLITLDADSYAEATAVSVTLAGTARTDVQTQALTNAVGIDGGDGNDVLSNTGTLQLRASSSTTAYGVQVSLVGTTGSDVLNTPVSRATAMSGGSGDDTVILGGNVRVTTNSSADVSSSSWSIAGAGGSRAGVDAGAFSTVINGGSGDDTLVNRATSLTVESTSYASVYSSGWTFAGTAGTEAALKADTRSVGIDGGDGADYLRNETAITATSYSSLTAQGGSNAIFGNASTATDIGAQATTIGLSGGAGNDRIENVAGMTLYADSYVDSTRSSFAFAGGADINELLKSKTTVIGLDGGLDNDAIYNNATLTIGSFAGAITNGSASAMLGGSTSASGKAVAESIAAGIVGGEGNDAIENRGTLNVTATISPQTNNSSDAGVFFGGSQAQGWILGTINATGLDGGNGDNSIANYGNLNVRAYTFQDTTTKTAHAFTYANAADFEFFLGGGDANALAQTEVIADAVGIRAGNGNNAVLNAGVVSVRIDQTLASSHIRPDGGGVDNGRGDGESKAFVRAYGSGMLFGDGNNSVLNNNSISVLVTPLTRATTQADGRGVDSSTTYVTSSSEGHGWGIRAGNGNHYIANNANLNVTTTPVAESLAHADGGGLSGNGAAIASNMATGHATGIAVGNGSSIIDNHSFLTVLANPRSLAVNDDTNSIAIGHLEGDADAHVQMQSHGKAIGIDAGVGSYAIANTGTMSVTASPYIKGGFYASAGGGSGGHNNASMYEYADALAIGIQVGGGNAVIDNSGSITVRTIPTLLMTAARGGDDGAPFIGLEAVGDSRGIHVNGVGNQTVNNSGTISVSSFGQLDVRNDGALVDPFPGRLGGQPAASGVWLGGNGNKTVVNDGTITVTSGFVAAGGFTDPHSPPVFVAGAYASGDNNRIVNNGTIDTTALVGGYAIPSYAIMVGGNNNTVVLGTDSVTDGNIFFRAGSAALELDGTPTVTGAITHGDPARGFSLVLNNAGSFGNALPTVTNVTKNGLGNYVLPDLNTVQRLTVNQGTLHLLNDYRFSNTGVFQTSIYRDGSHGQLMAGNIVALGGTLNVQRETGAYRDGVSFDVVLADSLAAGSSFSKIVLPEPTRLVTFYSQQLADRVRITTDVESFTTLATTSEEQGIAAGLDLLMSDTSQTTNQLLGHAQNLTNAQATVALATLGPGVYNIHNTAAFSNVHQSANLLQERMRGQHTAELMSPTTAIASKQEPMRVAYDGSNLGQLFDARDAEQERSYGVWLRGFSQRGDQDADDNRLNGFRYNLSGVTFGYDQRISPTFTLGTSAGSAKNHLKSDANMSDGYVRTGLLSFYGGYFDKELYLNGVLAYGKNRYDTDRNVVIGASTVPVSSEHDGRVFAATLSGGYYGGLGESFWFGPYASLQYTRLKEEAFTETGSVVALNVQGRATSALISTLGVRATGAIATSAGGWILEASLAWVHDYRIDDQLLSASYVGAPDASFTVDGRSVDRSGLLTGVGLGYRTRDGLTSSLKYTGEFRDGLHVHGAIGELRYEF